MNTELVISPRIKNMSTSELVFLFGSDAIPQEMAEQIDCELILRKILCAIAQKEAN
jgi:hypothetical protein